jgi:hypothetical protein
MTVDVHFQWFWQHGGYTDIQGLVVALRTLGLRGQFLDLNPGYSELGSLMGNAETYLSKREERRHTIAVLLPHTKKINKHRMSNAYHANTTQTGRLMFGV